MRASGKQVVAFDRGHLSPQDGPQGKGAKVIPAGRLRPRSLAGATILQLVPAMRDDPAGHAAVEMALAMVQSGARHRRRRGRSAGRRVAHPRWRVVADGER